MKTTMANLTGTLLITVATLGISRSQSAAQEVRLSDLKAQQPQEVIFASPACRRAREGPRGGITQREPIDPKTFVADLSALMEKSDEVILAEARDYDFFLSPSGQSVATYIEVRVMRSWKGSHHAGDLLTFGRPGGRIRCETPHLPNWSYLRTVPGEADNWNWPTLGSEAYVLFLRQSVADETKLIQGLRPAAGEGAQGAFRIEIPALSDPEGPCAAALREGSVQHCDSYLTTSQNPVMVPYPHDPLAKKYAGMPASVFLQEVQSVAAAQGVAEKSPSKEGPP